MESDLSVFHRIDDLEAVHPQRLIDLVVRLGFYDGVVRARLRAEAAEEDGRPLAGIDSDRIVDSSASSLAADPILGALIEIA